MTAWPTGWREATLRASGIPVSQFALDVLSAWQQSTPTEAWTSNPLGMPARETGMPRALNTPYAVFTGMGAFIDTFKRFIKTKRGAGLLHTLISASRLSDAWREIHGLSWPANDTETDYPTVLLDMVEQTYRTKLMTKPAADRKSVGTALASPQVHEAVRLQGYALHDAAKHFNSGHEAIAAIIRRTS